MAHKFSTAYIEDSLSLFRYYKKLSEGAMEQVSDEQLFTALDEEMNSIAIIVKHMAGNMQSRWTDFLTSDGEKPDRDRDGEFEVRPGDTRDHIIAQWERGWSTLFDAVSSLTPVDLGKTVRIRGEAHSVVEAINRQMSHYAAHVGQIVLLAKHYAGPRWQTLSIPRGKSREVDVSKNGAPYGLKT